MLHDLNRAARYATHLVAMRAGVVVDQGDPRDVITEELVEAVFDLPCTVIEDPVSGAPLVVPEAGHAPRPPPTGRNPRP